VVGSFDTVAAFARAPFARLAAACEAHRPENLSASVAGFGNVDAVFFQELSTLGSG
jgi:hypothetical protein